MLWHTKDKARIKKAYQTLCFILAYALVNIFSGMAWADEHTYKIEAVFLYNFLNYITWPGYHAPEEMKQATICVASSDPVKPYLEYIEYKRPEARTLNIRQLNDMDSIEGCQLLFVRDLNVHALDQLRLLAAQNGVLLVSTKPDFIDSGGMIGLSPEGERMAIDINNSQLKQSGFQISSRLLGLARKVK